MPYPTRSGWHCAPVLSSAGPSPGGRQAGRAACEPSLVGGACRRRRIDRLLWPALWAMTKAPVATVAALRETAILSPSSSPSCSSAERVSAWAHHRRLHHRARVALLSGSPEAQDLKRVALVTACRPKTAAHFWATCTIPLSIPACACEKGTDTFLGMRGRACSRPSRDSEVVGVGKRHVRLTVESLLADLQRLRRLRGNDRCILSMTWRRYCRGRCG